MGVTASILADIGACYKKVFMRHMAYAKGVLDSARDAL